MVSGLGGKILEAVVIDSLLSKFKPKQKKKTTTTRGKGKGKGKGKTTRGTRTTRGRGTGKKTVPRNQLKNPRIENTEYIPDTSLANNSKFCKSCGNSGTCCYCR
jgi:hypothetical protein